MDYREYEVVEGGSVAVLVGAGIRRALQIKRSPVLDLVIGRDRDSLRRNRHRMERDGTLVDYLGAKPDRKTLFELDS